MHTNNLFIQSHLGSSTVDVYPTALRATKDLFDLYSGFVEQFNNKELELADYVKITTEIQVVSAQIEQVNGLFNFFKTFEKGLQSGITA